MMIMMTMQYNGDEENYDDNAYDDDADEDDYDDEYEDDFDLCAVIIKDDIEAGCWLLAPLKFYSSWEKNISAGAEQQSLGIFLATLVALHLSPVSQ